MIPQKIELANIFGGLSLAIDLAEGKPFQHALDVTYLALRLGEAIGLSAYEQESLYFAGLCMILPLHRGETYVQYARRLKSMS